MNPEQNIGTPQPAQEPQPQPMPPVAQPYQPVPQQPVQAGTVPQPAPSYSMQQANKKSKMPLFIVLALLVLAVGAVAAYMIIKKGDDTKKSNTVAPATEIKKDDTVAAKDANGSVGTYTGNDQAVADAKVGDTLRRTRINSIYGKLEEYFNNNNGYPATFTVATFPGIDPSALTEPSGKAITIKLVKDKTAASAVANPTEAGPQMQYIPYLCSGNDCQGYILRSFTAIPTDIAKNPYVKVSLN